MFCAAAAAAAVVAAAAYAQSRPADPGVRGLQHVAASRTADDAAKQRAGETAGGRTTMPKIKIEVYEKGAPSATITIPGWLVTGASKLLPKVAGKDLQDRIDFDRLIELLKDPRASGVVMEVEDHKSGERVVISIVADEARALPK
jgi:hypothetical protein